MMPHGEIKEGDIVQQSIHCTYVYADKIYIKLVCSKNHDPIEYLHTNAYNMIEALKQ